jgi:hypothetical protein
VKGHPSLDRFAGVFATDVHFSFNKRAEDGKRGSEVTGVCEKNFELESMPLA